MRQSQRQRLRIVSLSDVVDLVSVVAAIVFGALMLIWWNSQDSAVAVHHGISGQTVAPVAAPATTLATHPTNWTAFAAMAMASVVLSNPPPLSDPGGPAPASVPPLGHATAFGCGPAIAYLATYAQPSFRVICPAYDGGHQATTCMNSAPCVPGQRLIIIADPCPAAYMNEASNSWTILAGRGVIDPFGACSR